MKKNDKKYFQFPIFLLRDLYTDKDTALENILSYGVYTFYNNVQPTIDQMAKNFIYQWYNGEVPSSLRAKIEDLDTDFGADEDHRGFKAVGGTFQPDYDIEILTEIMTDSEIFNEIERLYKSDLTNKHFGKDLDIQKLYDSGETIAEQIPSKELMPMIQLDILFDFLNEQKTERELMKLAIVISMKSMLGNSNRYWLTNREAVLCRAFGYKHTKDMIEKPELFEKYDKRTIFNNLLIEIELEGWGVISYSTMGVRGFYVSTSLIRDQLIEIAENNRKANKIKRLLKEKREAKERVLSRMKNQNRPRYDNEIFSD